MNLSEIKSYIDSLTEAEMLNLNQYLVDILRISQKRQSELVKKDISIGMRVRINHRNAGNHIYIIEKIARSKATLSRENLELPLNQKMYISAPLSLIEIL
jgi:hypothetical protein